MRYNGRTESYTSFKRSSKLRSMLIICTVNREEVKGEVHIPSKCIRVAKGQPHELQTRRIR